MNIWQVLIGLGIVIVAVIEAGSKLLMWRKERKAKIEDRAIAIEDHKMERQETYDDTLSELKHIVEEGLERIEDKCNKNHNEVVALTHKQDLQSEAFMQFMRDRIGYVAGTYIKNKSITLAELSQIDDMYQSYHNLNGNGHLTELMKRVHALPLGQDERK